MSGRVHVVGAGMAGLAAAVRLVDAGRAVTLHEAAPQAGGRARSYDDQALGCRIDNGNHLLIAGNRAALDFLDAVGARSTLTGPGVPVYPFLDRATGERWVLRLNLGRVPWWMASPARRVPGTTLGDYLKALRLRRARPSDRVTDVLDPGTVVFRRLWQPLAIAALNTPLHEASATLLARVLAESIGAGGVACTPLVPREGLSETLVDPALDYLRRQGAAIRFGARLRSIDFAGDGIAALDFDGGRETFGDDDAVVLAVTAPVAMRLVPDLVAPDQYYAILNAHYRFAAPDESPFFVGIIGGTAEWVFRKRTVLSVTVSAADRLLDAPENELAATLWRDVAAAYELPSAPVPPVRIVRERRATFAATPEQARLRPGARTRWRNLALAGDWTDTGLPATIEGAIRSGFAAAHVLGAGCAGAAEKTLSGAETRAKVAPLSRSLEPRPNR
ncbi:MAG: hydroxysqualene dehydroxylase HpnE [Alphaproteobacteria bacterium]|nr:hydroxysqualene dehydroxylase HpnE [Alphaproteobacteria bacterium]